MISVFLVPISREPIRAALRVIIRARLRKGGRMANPEHLEILKGGVVTWNRWRLENPTVIPDLGTADLKQADLTATACRGNETGTEA
jgi:hypothetical protein